MSFEVTTVLFKNVGRAALTLEFEVPSARGFPKVFSELVLSQELLSTATPEG
jgi:hypothetical protein